MILQCPSCQARFMVADALIPPDGRTVKCGRCAHQWHTDGPPPVGAEAGSVDFAQMLQQAAEETPAVPDMTPEQAKQLPAVKALNIPLLPFKIAAPLLALVWMVVALYAYFPHWQTAPGLAGIYAALGVTDTTGLVFADVAMEKNEVDGKTGYVISGSIANHDAVPRLVPLARVQLKDENNEIIWSRSYPVNEIVKPGEVYPFRVEDVQTSFADRVVSIVLDVGNTFEMVMR